LNRYAVPVYSSEKRTYGYLCDSVLAVVSKHVTPVYFSLTRGIAVTLLLSKRKSCSIVISFRSRFVSARIAWLTWNQYGWRTCVS